MNLTIKKPCTLPMLIIAVAITAILFGILWEVTNRKRTQARKWVDLSNVRNIGLAYTIFINENQHTFPATENILDLAEIMANEGDLGTPSTWNSPQGFGNMAFESHNGVITVQKGSSSDYVILVSKNQKDPLALEQLQGRTPMIFLTGLKDGGTWNDDRTRSPYGNRGGAVYFASGFTSFLKTLGSEDHPLPQGAETVSQAIPEEGIFIDTNGPYEF